ncbi:MAG: PfkB family carbohydrate kinase [Pseudomonadota bacterium]
MSEVLCIGSVLWDMIGRAPSVMRHGSDVPGHISRLPGGVAMNIAMTLARFGMKPALLSAVGRDAEGQELIAACAARGIRTDTIYRSADLPTDRYMAIEAANGLIAAIADAHSLEAAGDKILRALTDGTLAHPYTGRAALDGNLTPELLNVFATGQALAEADLRVAPASPGKADRLLPFLHHARGTIYVNVEEAGLLCQARFGSAEIAAQALIERGAARVLVTDGGNLCAEATGHSIITAQPPEVLVTRVTGAGDTFMAAHIASEARGNGREDALRAALEAAASYVSGETGN